MRMLYFGDSYDLVKQALLASLAPGESWAVHPMFTEPVTAPEADAFARFLPASMLTTQPIMPEHDRTAHFTCTACAGHVFFDPNTGIRLDPTRVRDPNYIYADELVSSVRARPSFLTLVFDQSLPRGRESEAIPRKLEYFSQLGLFGFAYVSHACFVVLSSNAEPAICARMHLLTHSRLPESRVTAMRAAQPIAPAAGPPPRVVGPTARRSG